MALTLTKEIANKEVKIMDNTFDFDFDFNELFNTLDEEVKKDVKTFDDLLNYASSIDRELYLGSIDEGIGQSLEGVIRFWNKIDDKNNIPAEQRKPIKIYIDSIGGSLTDSFTIIDAIEMSVTPVHTIITGRAYSGGFFVAIAGHKRIAYKHASFMYHEGSVSTGGDAGKFRNFADFYQKQLGQLKEITLKYSNMTEEYYKEHQRDDLWLSADEAKELGLVDIIVGE